jgi:L-alanine-DL-glutamate epimerase-like enolase superfamily enzyme
LRWFEDICDPLDFDTHARLAQLYPRPIAAGEALFSAADIRNLLGYGGLRSNQDVLVVDPVHSYGISEHLRIVELSDRAGWPRSAHRPHGGHLFTAHVAAALGLGATESNPLCFQPFGGLDDLALVQDGTVTMPESPGIGFEAKSTLRELLMATANGSASIPLT